MYLLFSPRNVIVIAGSLEYICSVCLHLKYCSFLATSVTSLWVLSFAHKYLINWSFEILTHCLRELCLYYLQPWEEFVHFHKLRYYVDVSKITGLNWNLFSGLSLSPSQLSFARSLMVFVSAPVSVKKDSFLRSTQGWLTSSFYFLSLSLSFSLILSVCLSACPSPFLPVCLSLVCSVPLFSCCYMVTQSWRKEVS